MAQPLRSIGVGPPRSGGGGAIRGGSRLVGSATGRVPAGVAPGPSTARSSSAVLARRVREHMLSVSCPSSWRAA